MSEKIEIAEPEWMRMFRLEREASDRKFREAQDAANRDRAEANAKFESNQKILQDALTKQNKFEDETKENFGRTNQNISRLAEDFETFKEKQVNRTDELDVSLKAVQANYTEVKVGISTEINPQISELRERVQKIEDNGKTTSDEQVQVRRLEELGCSS